MLGLVFHGLMEYELSLKFLQNALNLTSKYHGAASLKHAHRFVNDRNTINALQYFLLWSSFSYNVPFLNFFYIKVFIASLPVHVCLLCSHHLLATVYESKGEFRSALQHEKEVYAIYKSQVCFNLLQYHVRYAGVRFMLHAHDSN